MMEWFKAAYAYFGVPHPTGSLVVVMMLGALVGAISTGGGWILVGHQFRKPETSAMTGAPLQRAAPPEDKPEDVRPARPNHPEAQGKVTPGARNARGHVPSQGTASASNGGTTVVLIGDNTATASNGGIAVAGNANTVNVNAAPPPAIGGVTFHPSTPLENAYQTKVEVLVKFPSPGGDALQLSGLRGPLLSRELALMKTGQMVTSSGSFPYKKYELTLQTREPIEDGSIGISVVPAPPPTTP